MYTCLWLVWLQYSVSVPNNSYCIDLYVCISYSLRSCIPRARIKCILAYCIIVCTVYVYIPAYYVCQYMRVHYICPLEPSIKFSRSGLSQRIAEGLYIGRGSRPPTVVLFGYNIPSREKYDIERQRGAWPGPLSLSAHRIFCWRERIRVRHFVLLCLSLS